MGTRTNPNPKTKVPSKGQMVETIERAISAMEWPWNVKLTPRVRRDLLKAENKVYLEAAYRWAGYILNWQYGRLPSDDRWADYQELVNVLQRMYAEKLWQ